jgi:hypothetical protein
MQLAQQDPMAAGQEFIQRLQQSPKRTASKMKTIRQLEQILAGDQSAFQAGSRDMTDAVQFLISNALMSASGMGVMRPGMEDVAKTVSNMISEDTDFIQWTPTQRRMKMIAESYGYVVYQLPE